MIFIVVPFIIPIRVLFYFKQFSVRSVSREISSVRLISDLRRGCDRRYGDLNDLNGEPLNPRLHLQTKTTLYWTGITLNDICHPFS